MNAMILMSSLVFVDLEECIQRLETLTQVKKTVPPVVQIRQKKYYQPNVRYGEYLQQICVPLYCKHSSGTKSKHKPMPLTYKFRLRSETSYENLRSDQVFLEKRKDRNKKEKQSERVCNYKFWEPPSTLRSTDPKMVAYMIKLRMLKKKAKAKYKSPFKNVQYQVGGVSFAGGKPRYLLSNVALLPTGYIPINGGTVPIGGEYITSLNGFWKFPKEVKEECDETCDCLTKWEEPVMQYLKGSKCKCGHLYDLYHEGKIKEKYFHQATRHGPFWIDKAKVYQMDPMDDFIKDTVKEVLMSAEPTALLADLSDTPLLIPHLPQANLLNNLQEWVRNRVKGKIGPKEHKRLILQSQRRWLDLKHMDFRARAYRIPFTMKQLEHMNWSHRQLVQNLFDILLNDFVTRNKIKQVEQTRLWWSTTKYDAYPSKPFLDIYFTYMPGRMKDTFLINPYSSDLTPKHGGKTCLL
ncbi:uncharacterized protein LOC131847312 isoform X2 [Achroia grisella]|uniref:uncharacterized protein LOC131847312 isoform X2 n=1 Tax=Achroia grisella TaxID=688607 RepID=UPI0027D310B6|nr:uncharacterized protein LOC131847312 isoform X2 [Achroia grisella]